MHSWNEESLNLMQPDEVEVEFGNLDDGVRALLDRDQRRLFEVDGGSEIPRILSDQMKARI
jgi:hypothetical protein